LRKNSEEIDWVEDLKVSGPDQNRISSGIDRSGWY